MDISQFVDDSALDEARGRRARRAAVAIVEPGTEQPVRVATVGCSADQVFEVGSISKAITGMLLADAVDRGELDLQAEIGSQLPELANRPIGSRRIAELGSHRSGLPRLPGGPRMAVGGLGYAFLGLNPYAGQDVPAVIRGAGQARLGTPGAKEYSNLGGALAGAVLERATGSSYTELVRDRLAVPLGLAHTSAAADAPRPRGRTRGGRWVQPWRLTGYAPAGGVTSTIDDLAVLAAALLCGSAPGSDSIRRDDCFWVREPTVDDGTVIWHNGSTGGYASYLGLRPGVGRGIAVLVDTADMRVVTNLARAVALTGASGG